GPALAVATDLEHDADAGQILVSEATWHLLGGRFLGRPLRADRIVVLGRARAGDAEAPGGRTMIGRQLELGLLLSSLEAARHGESQTVHISGEVGIGKSRLLQALKESAEAVDADWLECQ